MNTTAQITTAQQLPATDAFLALHELAEQALTARAAAVRDHGDWDTADQHWTTVEQATAAARSICTQHEHTLTHGEHHVAPFAYVYKSVDGDWISAQPAIRPSVGPFYVTARHRDYRLMRAVLKYEGVKAVKAPITFTAR